MAAGSVRRAAAIGLVAEALDERARLIRLAPHLVRATKKSLGLPASATVQRTAGAPKA